MLLYYSALTEAFVIMLFAFSLQRRYAKRETEWFVKLISFLGWFLGISIIAILPLDIYLVRFGVNLKVAKPF